MKSNHELTSMPDKPNQRGRQMTFWESDAPIVLTKLEVQSSRQKPGNAGQGKGGQAIARFRPNIDCTQ